MVLQVPRIRKESVKAEALKNKVEEPKVKETTERETSDMTRGSQETRNETEQSKTGFSLRFNSEVEIIQINHFRDQSKEILELLSRVEVDSATVECHHQE